ncbi:MAG: hypothetical protein ABR538_05485 [Candidatus Binatia bacterium]
MDTFLFHPKLVHLPMALAVLLPLVSAGLLVAWISGLLPRRTWVVAVALQAVLVASSFLAMRTGENEEEAVEAVVAESAIESHEEAAEFFTWTATGVLVLFAAASLLPGDGAARTTAAAATAASFLVLFLGYRVGQAGGALVYRHGAAAAYTLAPAVGGDGGNAVDVPRRGGHGQEEEDDDD